MFRFRPAVDADQRMSEPERFIESRYGPRRPELGEPRARAMHPELPGARRRFDAFAGRWPSPASGRDAARSIKIPPELSGHDVRLAHDGLAAYREHQPDVVLLEMARAPR